jgi:iron complex transport system ATP-binding protein
MTGLEHFSLSLNGRPVLRDVTFRPRPGEFVTLCGPNGAGKTSILRALAGLVPGTTRPDPRTVAYLAQNPTAAWAMTVERIVALGRIPHGAHPDDAAMIARAMLRCGVEGLRHARIDRISGGEVRRAMLARVFATGPEIFLLDEPTADLDPAASHAILRLLRETAEEGAAVVAVLHAAELAADYAHRVVLVDQGRIVADLPPDQALDRAAALFGMRLGAGPRLMPPS